MTGSTCSFFLTKNDGICYYAEESYPWQGGSADTGGCGYCDEGGCIIFHRQGQQPVTLQIRVQKMQRHHAVSETDFRLKKYNLSETYIFREVNVLVIHGKKKGNHLLTSFSRNLTFIFSSKNWHFAISCYPPTPCSSCFNFKLPF